MIEVLQVLAYPNIFKRPTGLWERGRERWRQEERRQKREKV
jgi:hypothetical protein